MFQRHFILALPLDIARASYTFFFHKKNIHDAYSIRP